MELGKRTRSAGYVLGANFFRYFLVALSGILVAKILGPENYAIKTLVFSIAGAFSLLSEGGLLSSVIKLGSERKSKLTSYLSTGIFLKFLFSLFFLLLFFLASPYIDKFYNFPISPYLSIMLLAYFILNFDMVAAYWSLVGNFKRLSKGVIATGLAELLVIPAAYFFGLQGLFYATVLVSAIMVASFAFGVSFGRIDTALVPKLLALSPAIYASRIFYFIILNAQIWIVARMSFGNLAFYSLAFMPVYLLMTAVDSVSMVLIPEFSRMFSVKNKTKARLLLRNSLKKMAALALAFSILIPSAMWLLISFFLTDYSPAKPLVFFILFPFALEAVFAGIGVPLLNSCGRQATNMKIRLLQAVLLVATTIPLVRAYSIWGAIAALWLTFTISSLIYLRESLAAVAKA